MSEPRATRWPGHLTYKELCARWGCSQSTARKALSDHGVWPSAPRGQCRPLLIPIDEVKKIEREP